MVVALPLVMAVALSIAAAGVVVVSVASTLDPDRGNVPVSSRALACGWPVAGRGG